MALINTILWTFLTCSVCILDLPKSEAAFLYVYLNVLLFNIGYFGAFMLHAKKDVNHFQCSGEILSIEEQRYNRVVIFVAVIHGLSILYLAIKLGFRFSVFFNLKKLMYQMNTISSARYTGGENNLPLINRIVNVFVYVSCGFSGLYMSKKGKFIHLINLILLIFQTIILNTKATFVFGLCFWFGGYFTGDYCLGKKIKIKNIFIILFIGIVFLFFFTLINYFRHVGTYSFYYELKKIMYSYFIGPFSAFSTWFKEDSFTSSLDLGSNTFSCIFRLIGIKEQEHGTHIILEGVGIDTNVYTIFKHLVLDFSTFGVYIVSYCVGSISGRVNYSLYQRKTIKIGLSIVILSTIIGAFFSSLFRYTTNVLACLILVFIFLPIQIVLKSRY